MKTTLYKELKVSEINKELFSSFDRYQEVKNCWRKEGGKWSLREVAFTEQWGSDEYEFLTQCLQNTVGQGGAVFGAFEEDDLIGFASVEGEFWGSHNQYLQLSSIHTSYGKRGSGIGKELFSLVCNKAKQMGAEKLYISAHSSEETQAFYKTLGCVEAAEYNNDLVSKEPFDCQLEYRL